MRHSNKIWMQLCPVVSMKPSTISNTKKEINPQREMSQHQKDTIDKYLDILSFPEEAKSKYSDCFDFLNKYSV